MRNALTGDAGLTVLSLIAVLLVWYAVSLNFRYYLVPSPLRLAGDITEAMTGGGQFSPFEHYFLTLQRIVASFVLSMVIGTVFGIGMGRNRYLDRYLSTPLLMSMGVPALIYAFLYILWFGLTTYLVPILVMMSIVVPYVTINTWEGIKDIDTELVEMAQSFDAGGRMVWRHLYLPHLMPYTFSTARIAFSVSWKISLIAEVFGTGGGVGYLVKFFYRTQDVHLMIAWSVPIMLLMFVLERTMKRIEERSFEWRPELEELETGAATGGA